MTYASERATIETRFNTIWAAATPIAWQNVEYIPVTGTSFVRFSISPNSAQFASLGKHQLNRFFGIIEVNVMTPLNSGTNIGRALVDNTLAVFRDANGNGWQGGGITCRAGYLASEREEGEWLRQIVLIPFIRDESF